MEERLKKIEARAKALGWNFHLDDSCDNPRYEIEGYAAEWQLSGHGDLDIDLQAAERLLSAYEPGPTIRFYMKDVQGLGPKMMIDYDKDSMPSVPGTYKLIPVEVDDG